jgi:ABC-type multidrug transport system fused ATPase/permease subunit
MFLAKWGEAYHAERIMSGTFLSLQKLRDWWDRLPLPQVDIKPWLKIYVSLSFVQAVIALLSIALSYYASYRASRALFYLLLQRLTRAPTRFFDTTPIGRILNRFTGDIGTLDHLQSTMKRAIDSVLSFLTSFFVVIVLLPSFTPFAVVIAWLSMRLGPRYIYPSRDLRRLETVHLSPTFTGFDELLAGIAHIRAFGMESHYHNMFYKKLDNFQTYDHIYVRQIHLTSAY